MIEKFDPGTGKLRLVEARAGWCVDQLAATSEWILATMSIGIHSGATEIPSFSVRTWARVVVTVVVASAVLDQSNAYSTRNAETR